MRGNRKKKKKPKKFKPPPPPPRHTPPKGPVQKRGLLLIRRSTLYPMHSTLNILMFLIVEKRNFSCPT